MSYICISVVIGCFLHASSVNLQCAPTFNTPSSPININENDDTEQTIWNLNVTCCPTNNGSTIPVDCTDSCSATYSPSTSPFEQNGSTIYKRPCSKITCGNCLSCPTCNVTDGCLDAQGTSSYTIYVTCSTSGYDVDTSSTSSVTVNVLPESPTLEITLAASVSANKAMSVGDILATTGSTGISAIREYKESTSVASSYLLGTSSLFALNTSNGKIFVKEDLSLEYSYTYTLGVTIYSRRQSASSTITINLNGCFQTPTCNNQSGANFSDQHGIGDQLFDVDSDDPSAHFSTLSSTWQELNYSLISTTLSGVLVDGTSGIITTTGNITVWPDHPHSTHTIVVEVSNSESCTYTSRCTMSFSVNFTNWPISITNLDTAVSIHEDEDSRKTIRNIITYDYNNPDHDNVTCEEVSNDDTYMFELVHDGNHTYNAYSIVKKRCNDTGCGFVCASNISCMNHNLTQSYTYTVKCTDAYGDSDTKTLTINVLKNQAPVWTNVPNTIILNTDTVAHFDILFSIFYTDDERETLTYNYTTTPSTTLFAYDTTGNYYNSAANITSLSYQWDLANSTYLVEFCGKDRRNIRCSSLTIELRDYCGPTPTCNDAYVAVSDQFAVGGTLFSITVNPAPVGQTFAGLLYVIVSEYSALFDVDPATGVVTSTGALSVSDPPNNSTYYLVANVYDSGACDVGSCSLRIDVTFTNYDISITNMAGLSFDIHEDSNAELSLHTITTSDANAHVDSVACTVDDPNSNPPNTSLFYTEETLPGSNVWNIMVRGGDNFDYDITTTYTVVVICSDQFGSSATATMTVNILENQFPNITNLIDGQIINVDPQTMFNGDVLFTLGTSDVENDPMEFSCYVDNTWIPVHCVKDGVVSLRRNLLYPDEEGQIYSIMMCINDTVHIYGMCRTLHINITSSRTSPSINNLPTAVTFAEDTAVGTTLFTIGVTDPDVNDVHTFSLIRTKPASTLFTLNSASGELLLRSDFNFETEHFYRVEFKVRDQYLEAEQTQILNISVTDINETPTLTIVNAKINTTEGNAGDMITTFDYVCTDPDIDQTLTLAIVSGSSAYSAYFLLTSQGVLSFNLNWDFESATLPTSVSIDITCSDGVGLSDTETVQLLITAVNEFAPVLTTDVDDPKNITIFSNQTIIDYILDVDASDSDYEDDNVFEYKIVGSGKGAAYFHINSKGQLFLSNNLEWTYNYTFVFTIEVSDGENEPLVTSLKVVVYYVSTIVIPDPEPVEWCFLCTRRGVFLTAALAAEGFIVLALFVHAMVRIRCWRGCASKSHLGLRQPVELPTTVQKEPIKISRTEKQEEMYRPGSEMMNRAIPYNRPPSPFDYADPPKITEEPPPVFQYHHPTKTSANRLSDMHVIEKQEDKQDFGSLPLSPSQLIITEPGHVKSDDNRLNRKRKRVSRMSHTAFRNRSSPSSFPKSNHFNNALTHDTEVDRYPAPSPLYSTPDNQILYGDTEFTPIQTPTSALNF